MDLLIAAGVDVNLNDFETPLHCAVRLKRTHAIRALLRGGADADITEGPNNQSAMRLSLRCIHEETFARSLLQQTRQAAGVSEQRSNKRSRRVGGHGNGRRRQLADDYATMGSWDYGRRLTYNLQLKRKKQSAIAKLSRLAAANKLDEARAVIRDNAGVATYTDPHDYDRSAVHVAARFGSLDSVAWLVKEVGGDANKSDALGERPVDLANSDGTRDFLRTWPDQLAKLELEVQSRMKDQLHLARDMARREAAAKQGLRVFLDATESERCQMGPRSTKLVQSALTALAACPLGSPMDLVETVRQTRRFFPDAWESRTTWNLFQEAASAAWRKYWALQGKNDDCAATQPSPGGMFQGQAGEVIKFPKSYSLPLIKLKPG